LNYSKHYLPFPGIKAQFPLCRKVDAVEKKFDNADTSSRRPSSTTPTVFAAVGAVHSGVGLTPVTNVIKLFCP
jgi:hypothetical protein